MTAKLVYPYGPACLRADLKASAEDFEVIEELGFDADGEGEHWLIEIEKRGLSTPDVVARIARDCALSPSAIGFCGLKDKQAVCRQWLSLHCPGKNLHRHTFAEDGYRVLARFRHRRKLRRGCHRANRFRIRLTRVERMPPETQAQIRQLEAGGFANYFGHQRFGTRQDNVVQALRQLDNKRLTRTRKSLFVSALRSHLFNQILARRIALDCWRTPLDGDVFMLRGSHSIFTAEIDPVIAERLTGMDISCCASLYGNGSSQIGGSAQQLENQIFTAHPEIVQCLERQGVRRQMRALRIAAEQFGYEYDARKQVLQVEFVLPSGSYATSLLDHFIDYRALP